MKSITSIDKDTVQGICLNGDIGISMEYVLGVYTVVHELPLSIFSLQMGDFLK